MGIICDSLLNRGKEYAEQFSYKKNVVRRGKQVVKLLIVKRARATELLILRARTYRASC
jgi:hypothetical protein